MVPERLRPRVTVEVETPKTPAPPFETRSCAEVGWLVVARPVYATVLLEPPMREPSVPEVLKGPENARVVVATEVTVLLLPTYATWPCVQVEEVARPLKVKPPVAELYASG
jgi:hypothetical protein